MSLTRSARAPNSAASARGRPNSLTSVAPGAEKRSVICDVIAALCSDASRSSWPTREPTRRAGITNNGSRTTARTVICHDRLSITASVSTSVMTLVTTPERADVNARWAPMTSLFNRLTRAPVRVRVKKAIGIDCTCANTRRRRSRMRCSPSRDDSSRSSSSDDGVDDGDDGEEDGQTDHDADVAHRRRWRRRRGPPAPGRATPSRAANVARERKATIVRRCGRANSATRRHVARSTRRRFPSSCIALCSALHIWKSATPSR